MVIPFELFSQVLVVNRAFDTLDHVICEKVSICWLFKGFHLDILLYSKITRKCLNVKFIFWKDFLMVPIY